jgi:hypothetical protein
MRGSYRAARESVTSRESGAAGGLEKPDGPYRAIKIVMVMQTTTNSATMNQCLYALVCSVR